MQLLYNIIFAITSFLIPINARCANIALYFLCTVFIFNLIKYKTWYKIKDILCLKNIDVKIRRNIYEFIVLSAFAVFSSPNIKYSLQSFIVYLLLFIILICVYKYQYIRFSLHYFFISYSLGVLFTIINKLYFNIPQNGKSVVILIPFIMLYLKAYSNKLKSPRILMGLLFLITISIFAILISSCATAKLMLITVPFVYLVFRYIPTKFNISLIRIFIIIFPIIICTAIYFLPLSKFMQKFHNIEPSFKHRVCILKYSMEKIIENPLSGNGFKASRFYNDNEKECLVDYSGNSIPYNAGFHPHNFIIQLLFDFGVFGIIIFITIALRLLKLIESNYYNINNIEYNACIIYCFFIFFLISYSLWETWALGITFFILITHRSIKLSNSN